VTLISSAHQYMIRLRATTIMQVLGDCIPDEITLLLHSTQLSPCTDRCMDLCSSPHRPCHSHQSKYYNNI